MGVQKAAVGMGWSSDQGTGEAAAKLSWDRDDVAEIGLEAAAGIANTDYFRSSGHRAKLENVDSHRELLPLMHSKAQAIRQPIFV